MSANAIVAHDPRSFTIRGRRQLLVSGEIHYARSPRAEWPALLDRSRACGLNTIAAYVFWNWHEPERDRFEFTGDHDLRAFVELCGERGLHVLLRLGPYCCAEWNYGGYPAWLRDEPGITIRTWNDPYRRRVEAYFRRLCAEIRPCLATNGGPVVLCQVENEYANVAKRYGADGQRYLAWMADLARDAGIDVPIIMCEGAAGGTVETVNGHSVSDERIAAFRGAHPDLPMVWTELWPAWYDTWGFQPHRRDARNIARHLLHFVSRGGSGWNYYMWHGGTNFGRTSMYLQTTSYEFDAPLDEHGRVTPKGAYLARLHAALAGHADVLLTGERRTERRDADHERTTWRLNRDGCAVELTPAGGRLLGPRGRVLFDVEATWQDIASPRPRPTRSRSPRPCTAPWGASLVPTGWQCAADPFPAQRTDPGVTAATPMEQLGLTHDRSDYCWYSTSLHTDGDGPVTLEIPYGGDFFYVYMDGHLVAQSQPPFRENRGPTLPDSPWPPANPLEAQMRDGFRHTFSFTASRGTHRLDLLAVALGLVKGDWQISGPMDTERKGIWQPVTANGRVLAPWVMRPGLQGEAHPPVDWLPLPPQPQPCTWYRASFTLPAARLAADADWRLDAAGLGKGTAFINGHALGRYWLIAGHGYGADASWHNAALDGLSTGPESEPTQRYYRIPSSWLQATNTLLLFEEQAALPTGVRIEERRPRPAPESTQAFRRSAGLSPALAAGRRPAPQ